MANEWMFNQALSGVGRDLATALSQKWEDERKKKAFEDFQKGITDAHSSPMQMAPSDPRFINQAMTFMQSSPDAAATLNTFLKLREMGQPTFEQKEIPRGGTLTTFRNLPGQPPEAIGSISGQPFQTKPQSRLLAANEVPAEFSGIPKGAQVYGYTVPNPDTGANETTVTRVQPLAAGAGGVGAAGEVDPETLAYYAPLVAIDPVKNMPNLGFGAAGTIAKLKLLKAAVPYGVQMGGSTAVFLRRMQLASSTAALSQLTKNKAAVDAFASTAQKNWQLFTNTAQKVVDSGSPWINTPLRLVARQGLGSDDIAAFNAARQVATTEIARVISNPNLVGVLSDEARTELQSIVPENATLSQLYHVGNVLMQDIANRGAGLNQGIQDIQNDVRELVKPAGSNVPGQPTTRKKIEY